MTAVASAVGWPLGREPVRSAAPRGAWGMGLARSRHRIKAVRVSVWIRATSAGERSAPPQADSILGVLSESPLKQDPGGGCGFRDQNQAA